MLKKLLFNRVTSDSGFSLRIRVFRGFVEYREDDHICTVPVEPVVGKPLVRLHRNAQFAWKAPYKNEPIPVHKHNEIVHRVVEGLIFRKCNVQVVGD